jgi:hyperosmotically inducible periplasmic protein
MRRKFNVFLLLFCVALMTWGAAGCSTPAGRSVGEVVDDGTIKTKVKAKLVHDSVLQGFAIGVKVFQGEVTLTGAVNVPDQRERAERIALETQGVTKVNNLLKIK